MLISSTINCVISMNKFEQIIVHKGNFKSKNLLEVNTIRIYHTLKACLRQFSLRILQNLVKGSFFNSMQKHTHDKKKYFRSKNSCISQELYISLCSYSALMT